MGVVKGANEMKWNNNEKKNRIENTQTMWHDDNFDGGRKSDKRQDN